jgi:hypothetical protein
LQYGVLRPDLTPRPGYVALAAVGHLLADAKPLGRVKTKDDSVQGFLFNAKPNGKEENILVIWSENETTFELPENPEACFDHLGAAREMDGKFLKISSAPVYVLLTKGTKLDLIPSPKPTKLLTGKPGKVVIQAIVPEQDVVLEKSAYKISASEMKTIPVFLYNFGTKAVRGKLKINAPKNWRVEFPQTAEIAPGERKELPLKLTCPKTENWTEAGIQIIGDFGAEEKPVLALRFVP